jgi:hypothetical protein
MICFRVFSYSVGVTGASIFILVLRRLRKEVNLRRHKALKNLPVYISTKENSQPKFGDVIMFVDLGVCVNIMKRDGVKFV